MFTNPSIAGDWTGLTRRLDAIDSLRRWACTEPSLAGLRSVGELAELLGARSGTDPSRADAVIDALVRTACRAGGDDPDAALLLVHLLSDGLSAMAARLRDLDPDVLGLLVGELSVQIRARPLRRTRAYAANLLRDTHHACWRELRPHRTRAYRSGGDVLVDPTDERATRRRFDQPQLGPGQGNGLDLDDILSWARRCGIASAPDLALLVELEHERAYGTAARHRVAARIGVNERTVRRRRDRALTALRSAADSYLRGEASTSVIASAAAA